MYIHEYQAKSILHDAGVEVPRGMVARSSDEATVAFRQLGCSMAMVKAQIHAGGRGQGVVKDNQHQRGVQLVRSAEEAARVSQNLLGCTLVTRQTGPDGRVVRKVLVEEWTEVTREFYAAVFIDRVLAGPVLLVSPAGGMNIEEVAAESPELILREPFSAAYGLYRYQARKIAAKLGLNRAAARSAEDFFRSLCRLFVDKDCSLIEVNPLVVTPNARLCAIDAKMSFDRNAAFRQPEIGELRDLDEEDMSEVHAASVGLSYVRLPGNIGCLVNGAGLAMSTMDMITLQGGTPANFLDVGGGADVKRVTEAFRILFSDRRVKAVLVNIFGGITLCSAIAEALVAACRTVASDVPLVVRLEGAEVEEAREILATSGVSIVAAEKLTDATAKVVALARGATK